LGHLETAAPAFGNEHAAQWGELSSPTASFTRVRGRRGVGMSHSCEAA